jgi:hypothetical protein
MALADETVEPGDGSGVSGPAHRESNLRLGLPEAGDAVAVFPLAAFLEDFHAFKALHDVALAAQSGGRAEAAML